MWEKGWERAEKKEGMRRENGGKCSEEGRDQKEVGANGGG